MSLVDEAVAQLEAFILGEMSASDLEGWLDSAADEVHTANDPALRKLTDRALTLLAEMSYGHRTLEEVRVEVRTAIGRMRSRPV